MKPKPTTKKPREEWKKPTRRVRGRTVQEIDFGTEGHPVLKRVVFELRPNEGLAVRKVGSRIKSTRTWTFDHLANVANGQMELFLSKVEQSKTKTRKP